ncbi:MAG: family 43 glycosylhydrolase [Lachnospiraceae bacterium]|nr:family 43 glycosylhydrolase [Lachnospiraceae bacterium]
MLRQADLGDGTYQNPVLYGDYSDPDAIRVGDDYYMISSSFSNAPAIPILHSYDLVNWKVVNYVCRHVPEFRYINPIHGSGVWAPAIRYHDGEYYVFFPMPDEGIYMSKAKDPRGEWSKPVNMMPESGVIDPCPFWDDDGKAYLVTGVAGSRKGYKSVLRMAEMAPDGTHLLTEPEIIYDGRPTENDTIEGPKVYKKDGWYYIFAPAGGVKGGFQVVLRARNIHGPYEYKVVMRQGDSPVNGPHQGAWVDTVTGEDWFLHFQDVYAGGRIVHLQPMSWQDGWPVIGKRKAANATETGQDAVCADAAQAADGTWGEPVMTHAKPCTAKAGACDASGNTVAICEPDTADEFETETLGLQWQWNANDEDGWYEMCPQESVIRLHAVKTNRLRQLPDFRNLLLQKWAAPEFVCETKMNVRDLQVGDMAGIVSLGVTYAGLAVRCCMTDSGVESGVTSGESLMKESGRTAESNGRCYELVQITGRQEFDHQMAFAQSAEQVLALDAAALEAADFEVIWKYRVKIREYKDFIDRKDWQGNEVWIRHVPQEDIVLHMELGGKVVEGSEICIDAQAGRWVGVKNGVFCIHKDQEGEQSARGSVTVDYVRYA